MREVLKELIAEAAPKGVAIRCGPVYRELSVTVAEGTAEVSAEYVFVIYGWPAASDKKEDCACWADSPGGIPRAGSDSHA